MEVPTFHAAVARLKSVFIATAHHYDVCIQLAYFYLERLHEESQKGKTTFKAAAVNGTENNG